MIALLGGKLQGGGDVLSFQVRILCQDLIMTRSGCQQLEDILDAHPQPTDAGPPAALLGTDGDAVQLAQALIHLDLSVHEAAGCRRVLSESCRFLA